MITIARLERTDYNQPLPGYHHQHQANLCRQHQLKNGRVQADNRAVARWRPCLSLAHQERQEGVLPAGYPGRANRGRGRHADRAVSQGRYRLARAGGNRWPGSDVFQMTPEEIAAIVAECERRFRERTPPRDCQEVLASYRVGRGELRRYANEQKIKMDELDEVFQVAMLRLFVRLKREFPGERWDADTSATKELAKRHGIVLPRLKRS